MATQQTSGDRGQKARQRRPAREPGIPARGGSQASSATHERDEVYGLVSVLYHALQGAETYAQYVSDARKAQDEELVEFFEACQAEEIDRAERTKEILSLRLGAERGEEDDEDEDDEDEDEDDEDEDEDEDEDDEDEDDDE